MPLSLFSSPRSPTTVYPVSSSVSVNLYGKLEESFGLSISTVAAKAPGNNVLDLTGPGILSVLCFTCDGGLSTHTLTITIDGVEAYSGQAGIDSATIVNVVGSVNHPAADEKVLGMDSIIFNSSFVAHITAANVQDCRAGYRLYLT